MGSGGDTENGESVGSTSADCKRMMDLKDCIQDSPNFRLQLSSHEKSINDLEHKLEKVVQACDRMVSCGVSYTESCRGLSLSVKELSGHFEQNKVVSGTLRKFYEALSEVQSYYSILLDQAQRSVQSSLQSFLSGELRKVRETKKSFHKVSEELNSIIHRSAHTPNSRPQEAEDASNQLATVQSTFSHHAIDYGYQINKITVVKGPEILESLLAFMRAQFTFFHQGYELLNEFDPFMKSVAGQVDVLRKDADTCVKKMDSRHSLVTPQHLQDGTPDEPLLPMDNPSLPIEMCGYLFKRPRGSKLKSWTRRWFLLKDNKLVYQSASKAENVLVAEDLRICTVKLAKDLDRRFCFEVVTPTRSCMLQADSEALRKKWYVYLGAGIARALRISASNKKSEDLEDFRKRSVTVSNDPIHVLDGSPKASRRANSAFSLGINFLSVPGNDKCADCNSKKPKWASINLGIMLCIECSGIHRSLGVHISKVRSVTLDDWEPEMQQIMCTLGNARVNAIFEYDIPSHVRKPTPESSRSTREVFIKAKYVLHAFVHPHPNFERPEIPVPPPNIPDLLTPSKSPLTHSNSPKSPMRKSFSPSLKLRSLSISVKNRPSSASSSLNVSDQSTPADSQEDLRRTDFTQSEGHSALHLLAENLHKLEKSGATASPGTKQKSWANFSFGGKLKSARRSSKKLSNYALSKLSTQGNALLRRGRRTPNDKGVGVREVQSDTEDDDLSTNSTPLLYSMSASHSNLASTSTAVNATPPPKPPRTFKTKELMSLAMECPIQDEQGEDEVDYITGDRNEFSSDILTAIREVGVLYEQENDSNGVLAKSDGSIIANGRVPRASGDSNNTSNGVDELHILTRSESSPLLSHSGIKVVNEESEQDSQQQVSSDSSCLPKLVDLAPIAEAQTVSTDKDFTNKDSTDGGNEMAQETEVFSSPRVKERLTNSVPVRRKKSNPVTDETIISFSLTYPSEECVEPGEFLEIDDDLDKSTDLKQFFDTNSELNTSVSSTANKRTSVLSITSAEFYSAASSEASDSKSSSVSASPELLFRDSISSQISVSPQLPEIGDGSLRVPSSFDDECFSTPPSSPNPIVEQQQLLRVDTSPVGGLDEAAVNSENETTSSEVESPTLLCDTSGQTDVTGQADTSEQTDVTGQADTSEQTDVTGQADTSEQTDVTGQADISGQTDITGQANISRQTDVTGQADTAVKSDVAESVIDTQQTDGTVQIDTSGQVKIEGQTDDSQVDSSDHTHGQIDPSSSKIGDTTSELNSGDHMTSHVTPTPVVTIKQTTPTRKRSLTVSESLPLYDPHNHASSIHTLSKDDNFGTEYKTEDHGLISSFSQQDFKDIFGESLLPKFNIETVSEVERERDTEDDDLGDRDELTGSEADLSASPSPLEMSRVVTPETIEPVVIPDTITPDVFLYNSVIGGYLPGILCAIAHGGSTNFANKEVDSKTPMLLSIEQGNSVMTEYLFQNGAKLSGTDAQGRSCLHYAVLKEEANLVMMLLKRGSKPTDKDIEGKDPISYAVERENGDIVTMLRMATFKAQSKGTDERQSQYMEELQSEFFRDIEVASIVDPDRINKRKSTASLESSSSTTASRDSK